MNNHIGNPFDLAPDSGREAEPQPDAVGDAGFDASIYRKVTALLSPDRLKVHLHDLGIQLGMLSLLDASGGLKDAAHKMVSQAGMFGFTELSALCRELETALADSRPATGVMADVRLAAARALRTIRNLESGA